MNESVAALEEAKRRKDHYVTECGVSCSEVCGRCMEEHLITTSDEEMPPENKKNTSEGEFTINHQSYEVDLFGFHVQLSPEFVPKRDPLTSLPLLLFMFNISLTGLSDFNLNQIMNK